jgi:hypothetical protein
MSRVTFSSLILKTSEISWDVLEHGFAAIAEAWRLDGTNLQAAARAMPY